MPEMPFDILRGLFDAAVTAADPMKVIPEALPRKPEGRVVVIGAGKASARMAEAVEDFWGPCEGLVLTRYGHARPCQGIEIVEAAHPVPDAAGAAATKRMIALLESLGPGDSVLALISGGGSALLCAPAEGMSLQDKQQVHRALLESGVPIGKMNTLRKHLSRVKGGRLVAACYPASALCLSISDVPGDDIADIASGAMAGETTTVEDALRIVRDYDLALPSSAMAVLARPSGVVAPDDPRLSKLSHRIIAAPSRSLNAARDMASRKGIAVRMLGDRIEGEARLEGARQARLALEIGSALTADSPPVLLLSGGECTVSGRGGGVGGPNAEFALSAAITLNGRRGVHLIACDTDGVDGAAEVAGAVVGPQTLEKARVQGMEPAQMLARNDSHTFFDHISDQVVTGPTLTNVNDFRAFLISPR